MKSASTQFWKDYRKGELTYKLSNVVITLTDGTEVIPSDDEISVTDNFYTSGADASEFIVGKVVIDTLQIVLYNGEYAFYGMDFNGASVSASAVCELSNGNTQEFELGNFAVSASEVNDDYITLSATRINLDRSVSSVSSLKSGNILTKLCSQTGLTWDGEDFPNSHYIEDAPFPQNNCDDIDDSITCLEMMQYVAELAGGYIYIDKDKILHICNLNIGTLNTQTYNILNGGVFDNADTEYYVTGNAADGGDFDFALQKYNSYDSGGFSELEDVYVITTNEISSLMVNTAYTEVTGVSCSQKKAVTSTDDNGNTTTEIEDTTIIDGTSGYVLDFSDNPLFNCYSYYNTQAKDMLDAMCDYILSTRFMIFECDIVGNPAYEVGDIVIICDRRGNTYASFISDITFNINGFTTLKCSAEETIESGEE